MNKTAIKNYAIWARTKLIEDIKYKAGLLGISEKEIAAPLAQSTNEVQYFAIGTRNPYAISGVQIAQRASLANAIKRKAQEVDYKTAYNQIVEEVAYTWFNRFIAVRFMEVNEYLPCKIRVLSAVDGRQEPDIVQNPFDAKLDYTPIEDNLINEYQLNNEGDKLFNLLFIKVCNDLSKVLPQLFEAEDDYTELLLNISYTDRDGLIYKLVHDIPEEDFNVQENEDGERTGQVEIIGWLYQYYISEKHDQVVNPLNGDVIKKEDIPSATQLFTPDWIVRYMVENSLGRVWVEGHPNNYLKSQWKYYIEEAEQEKSVKAELSKIREQYAQLQPEDIKVIDPCMGSGHILVYAFDVLMQIYTQMGYAEKEAAISILENNLYGLDIDERAFQLAYFAVLMKARQYHKFILKKQVQCHIYPIVESNGVKVEQLQYFGAQLDEFSKNSAMLEMHALIKDMYDAKEYGSIITVGNYNWELLRQFVADFDVSKQMDLFATYGIENTQELLKDLVATGEILGNKYEVVITNPPYLNKYDIKLKSYITSKYKDYKSDLFSVFIYHNLQLCVDNGFCGYMSPNVWMFIKSYEKLRKHIISNYGIVSLVQLAKGAFFKEATVDVCTFIIKKGLCRKGKYFRLENIKGGMEAQKKNLLDSIHNILSPLLHVCSLEYFGYMPNSIIAYWINEKVLCTFSSKNISYYGKAQKGLDTCDVDRFVRCWHEVKIIDIGLKIDNNNSTYDNKWFPYSKGGEFRKWYGNNYMVVLWENNGSVLRNFRNDDGRLKSRPQNTEDYFKPMITWSAITSYKPSMRYITNSIYGGGGTAFIPKSYLLYFLSLLNSKVSLKYLEILSPTLNFEAGHIMNIPVIIDDTMLFKVTEMSRSCLGNAKNSWDSFETSWDFKKHPLVPTAKEWEEQSNYQFPVVRIAKFGLLEWHYKQLVYYTNRRFEDLKDNEEELNRIFIDIYGLQGELTPEVEEKDVTVHRIFDSKEDVPESMKGSNYVLTKQDVVKSLLSYAVGCMFGRYSLDVEGLAYAGGEWDASKYARFIPDPDNVIPITDEDYFEDDIVGRFVEWLKVVYGKETLEENLRFVADALGGSGDTPRQRIRNYFLKDFFKDHCKTYQKRPIYWLYDSGKQNGFKALIYMHRYNKDTTGQVRAEYLGRMEGTYESEINRMEDIKNNGKGREVALAAKRIEKLKKQLKECRDYDEYIGHLALAAIDIDLDDGVKVNYVKVQTAKDGKVLPLLAKI